jgi:DNA-binding CsgD family transcriptional regulator
MPEFRRARGTMRQAEQSSTPPGMPLLTPRQLSILCLIARGLTTAQVAAELHVSRHTVAQHIADMLRRFGARSRGELIARAFVTGHLVSEGWPPRPGPPASMPAQTPGP